MNKYSIDLWKDFKTSSSPKIVNVKEYTTYQPTYSKILFQIVK